MPGAAYMSAQAAARCGAGLVTLGAPSSIYQPLASKLNEVMITPLDETPGGSLSLKNLDRLIKMTEKTSAVLIGCGLTRNIETERLVCELIQHLTCTVVLDADGINAISRHINLLRASKASLILTPHPGEMATLTGQKTADIQADRIKAAKAFAVEAGVTLVLKGADTVISSPEGRVYINPTGNPGMARGGSGDILAGMTAGLAAQGIEPTAAACSAAYIHGLAGDRCAEKLSQYGMLPTDMLEEVPQIFRDMSR
jgi:NAD(P)H-hydrate epimerase